MDAKKNHKNESQVETKSDSGAYSSLIFIALVFLIRAGYYSSAYLELKDLYFGDVSHQVFSLLFLLVAFFYLVGAVGFLFRKRFAYYLGWFLILPDIMGYVAYPAYAIFSIFITILTIILLINSRKSLKSRDKTDKKIILGLVAIVILYFGLYVWGINQPNPEEYQKLVTQEAIQKNDIKICDKLTHGLERKCMENFAEHNNNSDLCDLLPDSNSKDSCFFTLAMNQKNFTLCEKILNIYEKDACKGFEK